MQTLVEINTVIWDLDIIGYQDFLLSKINWLNKTDNLAVNHKCASESWFDVYNENCQLEVYK